MTNVQKIQIRLSEVRERLNDISGLEGEALTDEIRAEAATLHPEYKDLELRYRSATVAEGEEAAKAVTEPTESSETRERRELRSKARITDHLTALLTGRGVTGATAEYSDAVGTPGLMPMELLDGPEPEVRAVTPGPDSGTVTQTRPTVPHAFARTDAAALGIAMPMVASGEAHFPALTTAPPAGPKAKDAAADSTAAAFSLTKRTPGRITGQFVVRVEDLALMPSMERDLRQAIAAAMADNLDSQVIGGSGAGANLDGLFNQADNVAIAGATETFGTAIERFAGVVDGKHANGFSDVRALIGVNTFALYAALFSNNNKGDLSAYDHLRDKLGMLRVSTRVPALDATGQKGICVLTAQGQPVTVPVWRGMELIIDPYSQAGKGQRVVTAVTLVGSPFIPYGVSQAIEIHPKLSG